MKQRTILSPCRLEGVGLHSGEKTSLLISPAEVNSGYVFLRNGRRIPARVDQVLETRRGTSLAGIAVTEHLLAAAAGLGLDNLLFELQGSELPALDGSALPFVEALEQAGTVEQNTERSFLTIKHTIKLTSGRASLEALPYDGFKVDFMINFPQVGEQRLTFSFSADSFKREVAPARTFGYLAEVEKLKEQGLARGASLDNALVLGEDGYLNRPRFPDELVRHKVLDLIGDLALLGKPLKAEIKAARSGHALNIELVKALSRR